MAITQELIDKTETNLNRWDDIVNEDENGTTTLDNALVVKSLAGYLAEFKSYNILGAWQTGYSYSIKDVAKESGNHYICLEAHTSGTFSTDLSSGKWGLFQVDFSNLTATGTFTGTFTGDVTGDVTGNVTGDVTGNVTGDLTGSVLQASQTNITSVGTLESLAVSGDVTVDTSTFKVDTTNNRVGVGLSSPSHRLDVDDSSLNSGNVGTVARIKASGTSSTAVTVLNVQDSFYVNGLGDVGLGTSSPFSEVSGSTKVIHISHNNLPAIRLENTAQKSYEICSGTSGELTFRQDGAEVMQITSGGDINIGNASTSSNGIILYSSGVQYHYQNGTGASNTVRYYRNVDNSGVLVGSITTTGSSTSYNTSSDYRLKKNVSPIIDGVSRLMKLKPSRFNFINIPKTEVDGFLAHEVKNIVPEAVTGEKDAVDEEGNPEYQSIDQSKIVPLLVASVQELKKELDELK